MQLCVDKITKQSQTTDFALFPRCYISGCSDGTGRQHTSSRVEVRWPTSSYRSAHELTRKSRGACSAARSPRPTHDALQRRALAAARCKLPERLKAHQLGGQRCTASGAHNLKKGRRYE